jgi:hypothetical protein
MQCKPTHTHSHSHTHTGTILGATLTVVSSPCPMNKCESLYNTGLIYSRPKEVAGSNLASDKFGATLG